MRSSNLARRSSQPRFIVFGAVGILILIVTVWELLKPKSEDAAVPVKMEASTATAAAPVRVRSLPSFSSSSLASSTAPHQTDLQALKDASREEVLAAARDLIAKGQPLEDVIAFLNTIASTRPEFALEVAKDTGRTDRESHILLVALANDWAHRDPASALQWALQKSNSYNMQAESSLLYVVLEQVAADDPRTAVSTAENAMQPHQYLLSEVPAGEVIHLAMEALTKTGHSDMAREAIQRWARGPEASSLDNAAFEVVAMSLAQSSSADAAAWLKSLPSSAPRNQALATISTVWVQSDPRAAMDWSQGLSSADGREEMVAKTFERWLNQDWPTATQWLAEHEASPDSDRMIGRMLVDSHFVAAQPQIALQWAELIQNPAVRAQSLESVINLWGQTDPAGAMHYATQSPLLQPDQKARLVEQLQDRPRG